MKQWISIIFLTAFVSYAQIQGPKIFLPVEMYDFGTTKQGEKVNHSFAVVNKGDDTLKISGVTTSCGCTAADLPKKEILPGETINIALEFSTTGRVGVQTKYIAINSNDKEKPVVKFTLTGNVVVEETIKDVLTTPKMEFQTNQYDFGVVQEGKIVEYIFTFKNTGGADLEIKDIKTSCGCTVANVSGRLIEPGKEGTLRVEFDTSNRFGKVSRNITVTTNEPGTPLKSLTIYAEIVKKEG